MKKLKEWFLSILKNFEKTEVLSKRQEIAFHIFELCLYDKDIILYFNSDDPPKRYIVSKAYLDGKDVSTFIILEPGVNANNITIVNHRYSYDIPMSAYTFKKITKMFDTKVAEDRKKMEKEILGNIDRSLESVLFDLELRLNS